MSEECTPRKRVKSWLRLWKERHEGKATLFVPCAQKQGITFVQYFSHFGVDICAPMWYTYASERERANHKANLSRTPQTAHIQARGHGETAVHPLQGHGTGYTPKGTP